MRVVPGVFHVTGSPFRSLRLPLLWRLNPRPTRLALWLLLPLTACAPLSQEPADSPTPPGDDDTSDPPVPSPASPPVNPDDHDGDGVPGRFDCDDTDPSISPDAAEICDGRDNDCDNRVDDGLPALWYPDNDHDGYGRTSGEIRSTCVRPVGYTPKHGDCDDTAPDTHPYAREWCDDVDNDCDGALEGDALTPRFHDADGDGFGGELSRYGACTLPGESSARGDCDDADDTTYPGAEDAPGDARDRDCGGTDAPEPHAGLNARSHPRLQDALDVAPSGVTVWVGPGTWPAQQLTWPGRDIALVSTHLATATVFDGGMSDGPVVVFNRGEGPGATLDGFTITGGRATRGGGIYVEGSNCTIRGCDLRNNLAVENDYDAYSGGGALYLLDAEATLEHCTFSGNEAWTAFSANDLYTEKGGAVYLRSSRATFTGCRFVGNRVKQSSNYVDNASYATHRVTMGGSGGAVHLHKSDAAFTDCRFEDNEADVGGAIYADYSTVLLEHARFSENVAVQGSSYFSSTWCYGYSQCVTESREGPTGSWGGAIASNRSSLHLAHVSVIGSTATDGGGLAVSNQSTLTLEHTVIAGNTTNGYEQTECTQVNYDPPECTTTAYGARGGGLYVDSSSTISASILAYNSPDNLFSKSGTTEVTQSDLYNPDGPGHNLLEPGSSLISAEPGFLRYQDSSGAICEPGSSLECLPAALHLARSSLLIDAADTTERDPDGTRADIGLYGGPAAGDRDLDGDSVSDWFWPGTIDDAPGGFEPADYDCDDTDFTLAAGDDCPSP